MQSITKKNHELTLADRLSRLNFRQVCKLLGEGGEQLIQRGGRYEIDIGSGSGTVRAETHRGSFAVRERARIEALASSQIE